MYPTSHSPAQSVVSEPLAHWYDTPTRLSGARSPRIAIESDRIPKQSLKSSTFRSSYTNTPWCRFCNHPTELGIVKQGNPNGHAGRPYYKCQNCDKFQSWGDNQGVYPLNPNCKCKKRSRREESTKGGNVKEYYKCATARCGFYRVINPTPPYPRGNQILKIQIQPPHDPFQVDRVNIRRNGYSPF